jgi:hypothetical protein
MGLTAAFSALNAALESQTISKVAALNPWRRQSQLITRESPPSFETGYGPNTSVRRPNSSVSPFMHNFGELLVGINPRLTANPDAEQVIVAQAHESCEWLLDLPFPWTL